MENPVNFSQFRLALPAHGDHPIVINFAAREQHARHVRVDRDRRGQNPPRLGHVALPPGKRGERPTIQQLISEHFEE
jgi:hypothetical protein